MMAGGTTRAPYTVRGTGGWGGRVLRLMAGGTTGAPYTGREGSSKEGVGSFHTVGRAEPLMTT